MAPHLSWIKDQDSVLGANAYLDNASGTMLSLPAMWHNHKCMLCLMHSSLTLSVIPVRMP
eukprot:1281114-Rhodomonas_salina.2